MSSSSAGWRDYMVIDLGRPDPPHPPRHWVQFYDFQRKKFRRIYFYDWQNVGKAVMALRLQHGVVTEFIAWQFIDWDHWDEAL